MGKIEVLAPAGNYQSFLSAVNNGADAVYLGLNDFNARGNIENFTLENIKEVVKKAHLFGVKVYLTLNILFQDKEIDTVLNLVRACLNAKVDAFIVQDIGLAHLLSKTFQGIELHASTQMGLENLEGVQFISKLGFSRVVLARETPLNEIKRIKDNTNLEIEYFVQGALCVAYSGNCYLCSLLAGASGNRGKCKQFCRLPYSLNEYNKQLKHGYLLSTKDFCNLPILKEMVESGVTSLKIEGRARRPAYVGGAVQIYRNAVDNNFEYNKNDILKLKKLFNRGGYIEGYFKNDKIIYPQVQNHMGVEIGKVIKVNKGSRFNEVLISSKHNLIKGDSLKFFINNKEVASVNVQDVKKINENNYLFTTTTFIPPNANVNLILDNKLEEEILNKKKKIEIEAIFDAKVNHKAKLTFKVNKIEAIVESDDLLEEAKTQALSKDDCFSQISKLGEDFCLLDLKCNIENVFLRKATLNEMRRNCLAILEDKIIKNNEKNIKIKENIYKINENNVKNKKLSKNIYIFETLNTLENKINNNDYFVYSPAEINKKEIIDLCLKYSDKVIYLDVPLIVTMADVKYLQEIYNDCSNLGVYANNYYAFSLTSPDKTIVSPEMNVFNSYAVDFYIKNGYDKIVLSKELFDFDNILSQNAEIFMISEAKQRLMYFKHCPIKEHIGGECLNCKYTNGLSFKLGERKLVLKRKKTKTCQFYIIEDEPSKNKINKKFGLVRELF